MHRSDRLDAVRRTGPSPGWRWLSLLLATWALAACRPGETWEAPEDASLGDLVLVVHGNSAGRQLEVMLERLEPDGCLEGSPGCEWIEKDPLLLDLVESQLDETWSGKLEKVEVGNYRLDASASVGGGTFGTASKVPVEIRKDNHPQLHLLLRQQVDMAPHHVPYFTSLLLDVHPVEPGGTAQLTIGAGPATANLQLWARSEAPVPQGSSTCPGGGCNRGTFAGTFPRSLDPTLGATLTWQAPTDPGAFHHPIELEIQDAENATAKIRFQIEAEKPCATFCDSVCVDHQTDANHCGNCATKCTGRCIGGSCDPIASIAAGYHHTCALTGAGDIYCWGRNSSRQIGHLPHQSFYTLPVKSEGSDGQAAKMVSAGDIHTCAILADKTARCWGNNSDGQLGNGDNSYTTPPSGTPVEVLGLTNLDLISVENSLNHTCARTEDKKIYCWGANGSTQLGVGNPPSKSASPLLATAVTFDAKTLSTGAFFSCSATDTDEVFCWGDSSFGKPWGNGLKPVQTVTAGYSHACALKTDGTVHCWGDNELNQVAGFGRTWDPTPISGIVGATKIDAGIYTTCALVAGGKIKCWGWNGYGQLGNGGTGSTHIPVDVENVQNAVQISVGSYHACARLADTTVKCWGDNAGGQLGRGTSTGTRLKADLVTWTTVRNQ